MFEAEIRKIMEDYKEEIEEAGCEHQRQNAMEYAFNRILELVGIGDDK